MVNLEVLQARLRAAQRALSVLECWVEAMARAQRDGYGSRTDWRRGLWLLCQLHQERVREVEEAVREVLGPVPPGCVGEEEEDGESVPEADQD